MGATGVAFSNPTLEELTVTGNVALGNAATDLIGFHGATAVDQAAAQTCISTSAAVSVCGLFAFTSAQANALITGMAASLLSLFGLWMHEHLWIKAGQAVPLS